MVVKIKFPVEEYIEIFNILGVWYQIVTYFLIKILL
jgi:hypothetical protein